MMTDTLETDSLLATIAGLQGKRAALHARRETIASELQQLGFEAHAQGSPKAATAVGKLNAELTALANDEISLGGALAEGQRRLAEARRQAARAVDHARADAITRLITETHQHGAEVDEAARMFVMAVDRFAADLYGFGGLGVQKVVTVGTSHMMKNALTCAVGAKAAKFLELGHIPSTRGITFAELAQVLTAYGNTAAAQLRAEPAAPATTAKAA